MCGIVAFVRKPTTLQPADLSDLIGVLAGIDKESNEALLNVDNDALSTRAEQCISVGGIITLVRDPVLRKELSEHSDGLRAHVDDSLAENIDLSENDKEHLIALNDSLWRMSKDACVGAQQIADLIGDTSSSSDNVITIYRSINLVLRSIDRIEVRGRDSAGISICLTSFSDKQPAYFTYRRAAEIGELGDNVKDLRRQISQDRVLYEAISTEETCHEMVLAHTRWASMGVISDSNTHPLDSSEINIDSSVIALGALNGDIDNHQTFRSECSIDPSVTTDAKLIPVLLTHEREQNPKRSVLDSFRNVVTRFEGSTAIAAVTSDDPSKLLLALRGGGQGLFIGLGDDEFMIASEPYGVVEVSDQYIRVDGETPYDDNPDRKVSSRGQIFALDENSAGTLDGLTRIAYDGKVLPLLDSEIVISEVTTRDIDRGDYRHYLWKEINEAPRSFATTLAGKFDPTHTSPVISNDIFPDDLENKISNGSITEILIIGQGTAAVAGLACAHFFSAIKSELTVRAILATEVSGFGLRDNMKDVLVIAVSQSGTTTDTNRTVDLLRDRGASVIAIVNRRGSDLTTKADGVCYTSSGRDVEMSVASTKAFYAQVAAGAYLAMSIEYIRSHKRPFDSGTVSIISHLIDLPGKMRKILSDESHQKIADTAYRTILSRRSWATVGNGANSIAAREIRIKSSELCYKAIALDSTEDKKHIDLSSEPLIVVCATGMQGSTADDVAKEIAIYRAHKACPIVITDDKSERFDESGEVIHVPESHPAVSFILAAVAGHIFGYESARAIDETARTLREARGALALLTPEELESSSAMAKIRNILLEPANHFFARMNNNEFDAILDASDATNLTKLYIALTSNPARPDLLQENCGGLKTEQALANCAVSILTRCIDQLTRPIDAIRHQAKTVTVGISRSDDTLLRSPSVSYLLDAGVGRDLLQYTVIRTLSALDEMIGSITGHTRYQIQGDAGSGEATLSIIEQKGSAASLTSRVTSNPLLRGTKSLTAREQTVWVAQGKSDGRNVILVPEISRSQTIGLTLLHIDVDESISVAARKRVLEGYKQRLFALRDAVTEVQDTFDENRLGEISIMELLTDPVVVLAQRWL
ncbi:MAG TPA: SIS domain-containing protein [Acidimicrobiia bacterium]|nr:SIS domain-containing protein [Acidimicrobiia bacterium]